MSRTMSPEVPRDALYPPDAAWMARTDRGTTRLLGYTDVNIDAVTGLGLGLFGRQPAVRHLSSVTPEILEFLAGSGLCIEEDMHIYRTGDEAVATARALIEAGYRLVSPYPLPDGLYPQDASVVPRPLWQRLNAKSRLSDLVDARHLAPRRIVGPGDDVPIPVYLKAGGGAATGWGFGVRYCETSGEVDAALAWFRQMGAEQDLVAEEPVAVTTCWCAHFGCTDSETYYLGTAEQTFSGRARQSGSVVDPDCLLGEAGVRIVHAAGEKARRLGFRGLAAIDVGLTEDGRYIAFDPNFRLNASSTQILLHPSASRGTPWSVSQSASGSTTLPMSEIIARLGDPARAGWFVATRLLDAAHLPAARGVSLWTGFVLGVDRAEAADRASAIAARLAAND